MAQETIANLLMITSAVLWSLATLVASADNIIAVAKNMIRRLKRNVILTIAINTEGIHEMWINSAILD